jgi:thiol-disulfide isomerase/thioredoxin
MFRPVWMVVAGSLALSACSDPEMVKKVEDLEARIKAIEDKGGAGAAAARPGAPPVNDADEQAAAEIFKAINEAVDASKYDEARTQLNQLKEKYPNTRAAKASKRLESELAVVGKDVPPNLAVAKWFNTKTDLKSGKATVVIFFEEWCPHCKREVPKLEGTWTKYKDKGLNMVGLTKVTKSATDEKVDAFIKDNNITYPVGKEEGQASSELFGVQGIPAAAAVKDGKIIWRGHPAKLTDQMVEGWIGG